MVVGMYNSESNRSCLTPEKVEWAYEKWCYGYTHKEIAKALFVHPRTINRCLAGKKRERPELKYENVKDGD